MVVVVVVVVVVPAARWEQLGCKCHYAIVYCGRKNGFRKYHK